MHFFWWGFYCTAERLHWLRFKLIIDGNGNSKFAPKEFPSSPPPIDESNFVFDTTKSFQKQNWSICRIGIDLIMPLPWQLKKHASCRQRHDEGFWVFLEESVAVAIKDIPLLESSRLLGCTINGVGN